MAWSADPTAGVARPRVDPDYTATIGLTREQGRALIAAADADQGRARLRSAAVIRLLLHNALRVDEVLGADVADLGADRGHQVLTVLGKGNRRAKVPLSPATLQAVHPYLERPGARAGLGVAWDGRAAARHHLWRADAAQPAVGAGAAAGRRGGDRGVGAAVGALAAPHRHHHGPGRRGAAARRAGLRPHRDARTTRRYDHSRDSGPERGVRRGCLPGMTARSGHMSVGALVKYARVTAAHPDPGETVSPAWAEATLPGLPVRAAACRRSPAWHAALSAADLAATRRRAGTGAATGVWGPQPIPADERANDSLPAAAPLARPRRSMTRGGHCISANMQ